LLVARLDSGSPGSESDSAAFSAWHSWGGGNADDRVLQQHDMSRSSSSVRKLAAVTRRHHLLDSPARSLVASFKFSWSMTGSRLCRLGIPIPLLLFQHLTHRKLCYMARSFIAWRAHGHAFSMMLVLAPKRDGGTGRR